MVCHPWVYNCHGKLIADGAEVPEFSIAGKAKRDVNTSVTSD